MTKIFVISIFGLILSGCFNSEEDNLKTNELGQIPINYYSNKSVTSLEVPPDLTKPDMQKSFRLSEFTKGAKQSYVNFTNKDVIEGDAIMRTPTNIDVKRSGQRRWLEVSKPSKDVWNLVKEFLKEEGFAIEKINLKTGIIETDFLENRPDIPDQSVGLIRSMIKKATGQSYTLPTIDKYKIRVEPINENLTEVYLSLSSMQEVVKFDPQFMAGSEEQTIWQNKAKDIALETEMLLKLMVYLGGQNSKEKIIQALEEKSTEVKLLPALNGYYKLSFNKDFLETWDLMSWAIDQVDVSLEDKDLNERAFYINAVRTADQGIMSRIMGGEAIKRTFQISLRNLDKNNTEVFFNDISEENEEETKSFSKDFLVLIQEKFK